MEWKVESLEWSPGSCHEHSPPCHVVSRGVPISLIEIYVYFIHVLKCPFSLSSWFTMRYILLFFFIITLYGMLFFLVASHPPAISLSSFLIISYFLLLVFAVKLPEMIHAPDSSWGIIVTA